LQHNLGDARRPILTRRLIRRRAHNVLRLTNDSIFWCFFRASEVYYSLFYSRYRKPDLRIRGPEQLVNTKRALGPPLKWSVLVCVLVLPSLAIVAQNETDSNCKIEILKARWEKPPADERPTR